LGPRSVDLSAIKALLDLHQHHSAIRWHCSKWRAGRHPTRNRRPSMSTNNSPGFRTPGKCQGSGRSTSWANRPRDRPAQAPPSVATIWQGAAGFWLKGGDQLSWVLPAAIFATVLLGLASSYGINIWNRAIFDALERRDASTVVFWSIIYFPLLAASVCLVIVQVYARMTMQRRWRAWLNNHLLDRWIANGRYYQLDLIAGDHKTPEYRIADDVRVATEAPVDFATGITTACGISAASSLSILARSRFSFQASSWLQQ
jgi:ABC-type uncharacterized transport system fused permease/ATPase subunit